MKYNPSAKFKDGYGNDLKWMNDAYHTVGKELDLSEDEANHCLTVYTFRRAIKKAFKERSKEGHDNRYRS